MFVGRKSELKTLEALYASGRFECVVIYGRRRVGKTSLIHEFIKGKDSIFYTGLETDSNENLEHMSRSIIKPPFGEGAAPVFPDFREALDAVHKTSPSSVIVETIFSKTFLRVSSSISDSLF